MSWRTTDIIYDGLAVTVLSDDGDYHQIQATSNGEEIAHIFTECVRHLIFSAAQQADQQADLQSYWDGRISGWEGRLAA